MNWEVFNPPGSVVNSKNIQRLSYTVIVNIILIIDSLNYNCILLINNNIK